MTAPASVNANSRKSAPVRPPCRPIGAYTAASVIVIAMIGPTSSRRGRERRLERTLPSLEVPLHVLDDDDRVVHDEADREHDREQRQQVDREAGGQHQERRADERDRDGHRRDQRRSRRAEEEEDHHDDDQQRLGERLEHLLDGVPGCRAVESNGMLGLHPDRAAAPGPPSSPRAPAPMTSSELAVGSTQIPMNVEFWPLNRTSES